MMTGSLQVNRHSSGLRGRRVHLNNTVPTVSPCFKHDIVNTIAVKMVKIQCQHH